MPAATQRPSRWTARRVTLTAILLMVSGYTVVFIADGGQLGPAVLRDAVANTIAAAAAAIPVWYLCRRMPWRMAERWWFLPVHVAGTATFAVLWYLLIALMLGTAAWVSGGPFVMQYLRGPALHWELMTALVLYFAVASSCYTLQAIRAAERAAALLRQSEVAALRAQLDPHLLFNTLHSLLELVRSGDDRADDALDRFARVVRYVTAGRDDGAGMATLHEEWRMAQDYVALESLRLGDRLRCDFDLGTGLDGARLPALTLQPLIENAIRHGIAPRPGAGRIRVGVKRSGDAVTLLVEDDGLGAAAVTRGTGTGLSLVHRRLLASFSDAVRFEAGPRIDASGWRVHATFPLT